jgi:hypothetical protein
MRRAWGGMRRSRRTPPPGSCGACPASAAFGVGESMRRMWTSNVGPGKPRGYQGPTAALANGAQPIVKQDCEQIREQVDDHSKEHQRVVAQQP